MEKYDGSDSIHPHILHEYCTILCQPLSLLFKLSLSLSRLTLDWKTAHIIPISKKGRKAGKLLTINMTSAVIRVLKKNNELCSC